MAGETLRPTGRKPIDAISLTQELVGIDTSHGRTDQLLARVEGVIGEHGRNLHTLRIPIGDGRQGMDTLLIGRNLGKMPKVLGAVHIDTVGLWEENGDMHPPLSGHIEDGKIYGRGTGDAKGAVAAMLTAVIDAQDQMPDDFAIALTADEEKGLGGILAVREYYRGIQQRTPGESPILIIGGNGSTGEIGTGSRGVVEGDLVFRGVGTHSKNIRGYSRGINEPADKGILHFFGEVATIPTDPILGESAAVESAQNSGSFVPATGEVDRYAYNMTPDLVTRGIGLRTTRERLRGERFTPDLIRGIVVEGIENAEGAHTTLSEQGLSVVEFHPKLVVDGLYVPPAEMGGLVSAITDAVGHEPRTVNYPVRGLEETVVLSALEPEKFAIIGPGLPETFHAPNEYANVGDIQAYVDVFRKALTLQI
jgi:acetylornithine deacetylase/succinyl-diaminopimelate desuccinylase-like protein